MCIAIDTLDMIRDKLDKANKEYRRLRQELSTADKTISDILHELEFCEALSASQGYKYARMLKKLRKDRRYIKNELEELQVFLEKFAGFDFHKLKKSLLDLENRQKHRKYTPRVLTPEKREIMLNIL
ncbi:hypothetical protein DFR58_104178 [Anaerobacterium chartisolvens]|uniref:Uncharacterized protein n=1 Tax=Anaerobacterium chartisolvens TaxID=1297424 RepID=A0A369BEK2_9FIRM|nr:hypothetical protein [Anaerobacterium chartisolvens]RCX18907.1 hypothetical protein DFR58_104178 [Anaerobacterium chartisolvens]